MSRLVLLFAFFHMTSASATNSVPELQDVMDDLMAWLPGEYSSGPQIYLDRKVGSSPDGEHDEWYRIFAEVDVPHIGENVIYGQLHVGSADGPIIPGTQILYIVSLDPENFAVNISGRRIKDMADYEWAHLDSEKLKTIEIDPDYGGNCDFRWRRHGTQIRGLLGHDGTCTMTSRVSGLTMMWDAEWVLNPDELWIFDNGYTEDGGMIIGREDRTHTRLYKVRKFECSLSVTDESGAKQEVENIVLHDRGAAFHAGGDDNGGDLVLTLLRAPMPKNGIRGMEEKLSLTLRHGTAGEVIASTQVAPLANGISVRSGLTRASCSSSGYR